jgi:hypothetical protein
MRTTQNYQRRLFGRSTSVSKVLALRARLQAVQVGRIMKAAAAPEGTPWLWTLAYGYHEDRSPTHGYAATREAAMATFAKSWRRE